jgi:two-component system sensor histidine kinase RpfC
MNSLDRLRGSLAAATRPLRIGAAMRWIAKRIRQRPDSEHEMTINRLVLSGLTLAYLLAASSFGSTGAARILDKAGVLLALYYTFSIALFAFLLRRPNVSPARRLIGILFDFAIFSYGMHIGGEAMAPFYPIYLWVIFGNGFRFGLTYLAAASACGVVSFTAVVMTTPFWHAHLPLSAGLASGLILLPLYVSSLIRKLSDAKRQAEEASRAKSLFLASVSHELRTPLNAIIGLSDLMRGTRLDAEQRDMTQTIGQSGRTLLNLINQILDFSRVEAGQMPSRIEPFDLLAMLAGVRRLLNVQAHAKGLRLALHVTPRTPALLIGDKNQLEEILINLVGNAVKFTARGHIVVAVDAVAHSADKLRLRVEVTDTGIGIAEEAQERIFESFTQANETILDSFGGTGLGLAIVKQLVERHGGEIGVVSAPDHGSTFWFEIDLLTQPQSQVQSQPAPAEPVLLLSTDAGTCALADAALPAMQVVASLDAAVTAIAALRQRGMRQLTVLIDADADVAGAEDCARRLLGDDDGAAPSLVAITDGEQNGLLPEPARSLFVTTVPRPLDQAGLSAAIAIAAGCRTGADAPDIVDTPKTSQRRLSILVAEDNRTNQKVISKILDRVGHDVTIVDNGEDALEALHAAEFDLVLMDVNMPVMNGIEATKLYRFGELGQRHVPIVALTADATAEVSQRCQQAGMDGCLTKPIEPARLIEIIERLVQPSTDEALAEVGQEEEEAVAAAAVEEQPAIEAHKIEDLKRLGGVEFVDDLVQQFLDDSIEVLRELARAAHGSDVNAFREQAHALRSGAANVGARRIYDMCLGWRNIDAATLRSQGSDEVQALETEFERVRAALRPHVMHKYAA